MQVALLETEESSVIWVLGEGLFYLDAFVMKLSAVGACKIEAQMVLLLAQLKAMLALKDDYNGSSTVGVRMAHRCASEH